MMRVWVLIGKSKQPLQSMPRHLQRQGCNSCRGRACPARTESAFENTDDAGVRRQLFFQSMHWWHRHSGGSGVKIAKQLWWGETGDDLSPAHRPGPIPPTHQSTPENSQLARHQNLPLTESTQPQAKARSRQDASNTLPAMRNFPTLPSQTRPDIERLGCSNETCCSIGRYTCLLSYPVEHFFEFRTPSRTLVVEHDFPQLCLS